MFVVPTLGGSVLNLAEIVSCEWVPSVREVVIAGTGVNLKHGGKERTEETAPSGKPQINFLFWETKRVRSRARVEGSIDQCATTDFPPHTGFACPQSIPRTDSIDWTE